jgi:hypothetical protein
MKAVVCASFEEMEAAGPGAIYWINPGSLANKCPGCGRLAVLRIEGGDHPRWLVAQRDPLTLSPSVNCVGCCGWHGWLKNGEWTRC